MKIPEKSGLSEIKKAAEVLINGGVVIFPTDTVYGIGCRLDSKEALKRIYKIKKRSKNQPFPILVSSTDQTGKIVEINKTAQNLMKKYWPGGLTIVLYSNNVNNSKVGVRMPNSRIVQSLIDLIGKPIIGTSANFHTKPSVSDFKSLDPELVKLADYVLKGKCDGGVESTVVDVSDNNLKIIRQGAVNLTI